MSAYSLLTWDSTNERILLEVSDTLTVDFTALNIGPSNLTISDSSSQFSFGDNPIVDATSLELGATGLEISESGGNLSVNSVKLVDTATPAASGDLANKDYADSVGEGLDFKSASKAVAATALPTVIASGSGEGKLLTAQANGVLTVDGVSTWTDIDNDLAVNDPSPATGTPASRVLIAGQSSAVDNGIFAVQDKGDGSNPFILVRASDFDSNANVTPGAFTFITEGTSYSDSGWVLSSDTVAVDATPLVFDQFTGAGTLTPGDGIDITTEIVSVDLATNSGLGFISDQLAVDLAAAGTGARGLVLTGNEIELLAGDSTALTSNGLAVEATTAAGTAATANALEVVTDGVRVRVDAATIEGSNQGSAGAESLRVKDAGITATQLNASVAGDGLSGGAGTALTVNIGDGLEWDSGAIAKDWANSFTNNEGATVTAGQVVYIDSDGQTKLAEANVIDLDKNELAIVKDATIADQASGEYYVQRGVVIPGYTGLTPGKRQYVSLTTPGAFTESLTGAQSQDKIYRVGRAKSATEFIFDPRFLFEWGGPPTYLDLVLNGQFENDKTDWSEASNLPTSNLSTVETYNPATSNFTDSEKVGSNNKYLRGANGSSSTRPNYVYQDIDISAYYGREWRLTASIGGSGNTADIVSCWMEWYNQAYSSEVVTEIRRIVYLTNLSWVGTGFNGVWDKTALRGKVDLVSGDPTYVDDAAYVVYHKTGDTTKVLIKYVGSGADEWRIYQGITWDFDDLTNNFDLGDNNTNFTFETVSSSGDDTQDSLNYPPSASSNVKLYNTRPSTRYLTSHDRYNGFTYDTQFLTIEQTGTIPSNAYWARVVIGYWSSATPNQSAVDEIKFEIRT